MVKNVYEKLNAQFPTEAGAFLQYFCRTYVRGVQLKAIKSRKIFDNAKCNIHQWNTFSRFEEHLERSNNVLDGFNNKMKISNVVGANPTLVKCVKLILNTPSRCRN